MKENAATLRNAQDTVIRRTRGLQRRRKGDEHEEDEVQEKVKEASDSVHTGENSMLKRGWGRVPLLLSMGNAGVRARTKRITACMPRRAPTWTKRTRKDNVARRRKRGNERSYQQASERTNERTNEPTKEPRGSTRCSPRGRKERTSNAERTNGPSSSRLCLLFLP